MKKAGKLVFAYKLLNTLASSRF